MNPQLYKQQYLKTKVETSSPGELTLLLYEELLRKLNLAKECFQKRPNETSDWMIYIHGSRSILFELIGTLNFEYEISNQLYKLYDYHLWKLQQFVVTREVGELEETIVFSREFAMTWKQAIQLAKEAVR